MGVLAVYAEALIIYLRHRATLGAMVALVAGVGLGKVFRPIIARSGAERLSRMRIST